MFAAVFVAVLAAAPPAPGAALGVRVLARHHPTAFTATARELTCDGKPLERERIAVRWARDGLAIEGGPRCGRLEMTAPELAVAGIVRGYRGRVTARPAPGEIALVEQADLEAYVAGVVGAESSGSAPAALQAQAIVSRTFALASRGRHGADGHDLCDLSHCQVYAGRSGETDASRAATEATAGKVLRRAGRIEPVWFHSSCGGATAEAREVFGGDARGEGVPDRDEDGKALCAASPEASWSYAIDRSSLAKAFGLPAEGAALEVVRKDRAGRILQVQVFGRRFSGAELLSRVGRAEGWHRLKSVAADVEVSGDTVRFRGRGLGHGVGLCQWGAQELARRGKGATVILQHYFPGATTL